jgi:AAA+ superfamily predicted ATPase
MIQHEMTVHSLLNLDYYFTILADLIRARIHAHFTGPDASKNYSLPPLDNAAGPLAEFIMEHKLGIEEHYFLLIALIPHVRPEFFDHVIEEALPKPGDFPQIGGVRGKQFRGFIPTVETALFLLAGENWLARQELIYHVFNPGKLLSEKRILLLETPPEGEPLISGKLILNQSMVTYFITGQEYVPLYSSQFPARHLKTELKWTDIVLNPQTVQQIDDLRSWLDNNKKLMKKMGMEKKFGPGYRALFYGPSGTGKTISATLLAKEYKMPLFRIDLSTLVSKYIGETEKNLARLFDEAEYKKWMLFFDEADALFGKRTQVKDAHDRYANQEVSYLMQRIETFDGIVILASNLKGNMDDAFTRRFQSVIYFPYPTPEEQLCIWQKAFPKKMQPDKEVDLLSLVQRYKLSGANIMNIVQYCCLASMANKKKKVSSELLSYGIQRELLKEGRNL